MTWKLLQGDSAEVLKTLDTDSIDLTVTSPPYDNLRDYNGYSFDFEGIAKELYRVTKPGGVLVWVVNDATVNGSETGTSFRQALFFKDVVGFRLHDTMIYQKTGSPRPEKVRYYQSFEYMFVLSKGKPKTINLIKDKPNKWAGTQNWGRNTSRQKDGSLKEEKRITIKEYGVRTNIWLYKQVCGFGTRDKIAYQHPAIFPEKLAEDHIITWSNPGDLVLDPLAGSGTTLKMAKKNERRYIGIEISTEYCEIIRKRLSNMQQTIFNLVNTEQL